MSEELSDQEIEKLRRLAKSADAIEAIILSEARVAWLWATARIAATWLSAAVVGAYAIYEVVSKFFKGQG